MDEENDSGINASVPQEPRRAYHAGLSRDAVVSAALEMLRARGPQGFSVRQLASGLGLSSMAVYKHVRDKDDLLAAALARVFRDAGPLSEGPWWEQVAEIFRRHRQAVRREPWALEVMLHGRLGSPEPWAGIETALALLQEQVGATEAARWARLLAAYTNGFLLTEPEMLANVGAVDTHMAAERPFVAAAAARNEEAGDVDFEFGLQVLVAALLAQAKITSRP